MLPEHAVILDTDYIIGVFWVVFFQVEKDFELNACLVLELFLVPDNLDCNNLVGLVINTFECLAERAFAEEVKDFEAVSDVVLENDVVVATLIVIATIELVVLAPLNLFSPDSQEKASLVVQDFAFFILSESRPL